MSGASDIRRIVRAGATILALSLLCAAPVRPAAAQAPVNDGQLLAHGSADNYWVARVYEDVGRGGAFVTDVYARSAGDANWRQVARVEGRTVQVAHRAGQLALLLDGGGWLLVSDETVATGRPPPPGSRLLSLAPWGDTLLALARAYDPRPELSRPAAPIPIPATSPASATGRSLPDSERLVLLSLTPQGWTEAGGFEVGGPLPGTSADASLAVVEGISYVAVREGPKTIGIYRQSSGGGNARAPRAGTTVVETATPFVSFKLLGGGPVPVLWTVEAEGPPRLHWLLPEGVRAMPADVGSVGGRRPPAAATYAVARVRVLYGQGLLLSERLYDALAGTPSGDAARVLLPRAPVSPPLGDWLQSLLPVLLLFTIISSLRRRREMQETMLSADRLPLAPFGRRLLAGAIDAAPVIATVAVVYLWEKRAESAGDPPFGVRSQVLALVGLLVYLLHTAASEIASGRTIGKVCCGLRVVGLDGARPPVSAMVTRNLLRLIDLSMMFFPLVLVLYSPLRQRAGDVAAGTLVVLNKPGPEPVTDDATAAPAETDGKTAGPAELTD